MKGSRTISGTPEGSPEGVDLSLIGLPPPMSQRPGSASAAKSIFRSVSVATGSEPRKKALVSVGAGTLLGWHLVSVDSSSREHISYIHGHLEGREELDQASLARCSVVDPEPSGIGWAYPSCSLYLGFFGSSNGRSSWRVAGYLDLQKLMGRGWGFGESCLPFPSLPVWGMDQGVTQKFMG